jgi:hypothetical protein
MITFRVKVQNKQHKVYCNVIASCAIDAMKIVMDSTQLALPIRVIAVAI